MWITLIILVLAVINRRHLSRAGALAVLALGTLFVAPRPAHAQFGFAIITTILSTINDTLGPILDNMNGVVTGMSDFQQKTIFPANQIQQIEANYSRMMAPARPFLQLLQTFHIQSGALTETNALENLLRNGQVGDFGHLPQVFHQVYQPLPSVKDILVPDRAMIDMDDATSQDGMALTKQSDGASTLMLQAADQMDSLSETVTPGGAPFLTGSALIASIESQAYTQKVIASLIRSRSSRLAHQTALTKRKADALTTLRQTIGGLGSR